MSGKRQQQTQKQEPWRKTRAVELVQSRNCESSQQSSLVLWLTAAESYISSVCDNATYNVQQKQQKSTPY